MAENIKTLETQSRDALLGNNYVGRLAFIAKGEPHIIPITYFYDKENNRIISYSSEGHKVEAMRRNKQVALCVDEISSVSKWQSVLVHGEYQEVSGSDAKYVLRLFAEGVKAVIAEKENKKLQFINEFSSKLESLKSPVVYQIKITETTAKYRDS
jgi:nitroimidazol reductase NimA-like FMN-containing flavoprotein (pyridoxamine 5'-phosphate oxidase superfamily)